MTKTVYVIQRDSRQDMSYESTPVIGVCMTERQALRYVIADIASEHLAENSSLLPSERNKVQTEQQRAWDSFCHVPRYWVSKWSVDSRQEGNDGDAGIDEIFQELHGLEYGGNDHPRRHEKEFVVELDDRIKRICAPFHEDSQVLSFFDGLRKASNVETLVDVLCREKKVSYGRLIYA